MPKAVQITLTIKGPLSKQAVSDALKKELDHDLPGATTMVEPGTSIVITLDKQGRVTTSKSKKK